MSSISKESYRHFGGMEDTPIASPALSNTATMLSAIRSGIVGQYHMFSSPYGMRPCLYVDWTASGRALKQIEDYIATEVLPFYGNTHTTTSITGHQSTCFRHESRQIIAESVNAKTTGKAARDVVLFTGSGTTAAVAKIVQSLGLNVPLPEGADESLRPIVFTSSYEHHSNLLPWRESVADVVTIDLSSVTGVCLTHLREQLHKYQHRKLKIGAFSAASNVTGMMTAVDDVSILMHKFGGIVIFDYATAAPYVKMDMNPVLHCEDAELAYKDAIVMSGHKFLGGPGTSGVLIAKKTLLCPTNAVPTIPSGGTVFFVTEEHQRYLSNREEREEGGTPNILGDIKMGLIMRLKQTIGAAWIETEELTIAKQVYAELSSHPNICLLRSAPGDSPILHLPIFSFLIRHSTSTGRFLHYNFVCALLNDLFGIQCRGGCMCAGPYSIQLLGISSSDSQLLETALLDKVEVLRPGYTRLSLPYWMSAQEIDYVVKAVKFIADHGYKFLSCYRFNYKTGEWAHATRLNRFPERKWLSNFNIQAPSSPTLAEKASEHIFVEILSAAEKEANLLTHKKKSSADSNTTSLGDFSQLRWFTLSAEESTPADDIPILPGRIALSADHTMPVAPENFSKYAAKRDQKLPSHVAASHAAPPRYLSPDDIVPQNKVKSERNSAVVHTLDQSDEPAAKRSKPITIDETVNDIVSSDCAAGDTCSTGVCKPRTTDTPTRVDSTEAQEKPMYGRGQVYAPSTDAKSIAKNLKMAPKKLIKAVGMAIKDWNMIEEGDRLLLGLSGGKDSLALLHILLYLQRKSPVKFTISCATVDPQTQSFDPSPLIPYVQSLGVTYHYLSEPIVELAKTKMQGDSLCAFCARFKRGLLYSCCRNFGYNKLVLAQHLDDLAESFIMSSLHNGQIRTMKANYSIEAGDVNVIRPLVYAREGMTRDFSVSARLPIINENCPACFEQPKERARIKKLLSQEETMVPALFANLRKSLLPLMHDDTYKVMDDVVARIEASGNRAKVQPRMDSECMEVEKEKPSTSDIVCDRASGYCPPCFELA